MCGSFNPDGTTGISLVCKAASDWCVYAVSERGKGEKQEKSLLAFSTCWMRHEESSNKMQMQSCLSFSLCVFVYLLSKERRKERENAKNLFKSYFVPHF